MPNYRRRKCTCCGKQDSEVGPISWQGNCASCGQTLLAENIVGIATKQGYAYKRRARGYLRYAERVLLDDVRSEP